VLAAALLVAWGCSAGGASPGQAGAGPAQATPGGGTVQGKGQELRPDGSAPAGEDPPFLALTDAEEAEEVLSEQPPKDLLGKLRGGGYVLAFRHAATDWTDLDDPVRDLGDPSTQRLLAPTGRAQAAAVGDALDALQVPVGEAYSSP